MHTQETKEPTTRINKAVRFAINFAVMISIEDTLKDAQALPETKKAQIEETICKTMLKYPDHYWGAEA
jgi:hypothetical protein